MNQDVNKFIIATMETVTKSLWSLKHLKINNYLHSLLNVLMEWWRLVTIVNVHTHKRWDKESANKDASCFKVYPMKEIVYAQKGMILSIMSQAALRGLNMLQKNQNILSLGVFCRRL